MQQSTEFVTFGEIQEYKESQFNIYHSGTSFRSTLQGLIREGKTHTGIPSFPDFSSWNLESIAQFRQLICQLPVNYKKELYIESQTDEKIICLRLTEDVNIGVESCYTADELMQVDYFTVVYVLSGSGTLCTQNSKILMEKGELCILPPSVPYYVLTTPDDLVIHICSSKYKFEENFRTLLFHDNPVSVFFRECLFHEGNNPLFFMIPVTRDIKNIIQHLFVEFIQDNIYSQAAFYSYLQIFYINIIRSSQNTLDYYAKKDNMPRSMVPAILEYIEAHYRTATLDQVAEAFHYEPTYFSRFIKKYTGRNYIDIITEIKIQEAKKLLAETDLSIESISSMCGYKSVDHFSYTFKKTNHCSPSNFRKESSAAK